MYDQVERVDFVPVFSARFDERILKAYQPDSKLLDIARDIKQIYDAHMRRIMAQHEIKTEFEVWSTFVLTHSRTTNDYKFHEQIGHIAAAFKEQFRRMCYERARKKPLEDLGPLVAAMYKITADEMAQAIQECQQTRLVGGQQKPLRKMTTADMPLMSFPWLFQDVLGKIANSRQHKSHENPSDTGSGNAATETDNRPSHTKSVGEGDRATSRRAAHTHDLLQLLGNVVI